MTKQIHYDFTQPDFATAAVVGPTLSFTRASDATFFNSEGTLTTKSSGEERTAAHVYSGNTWDPKGYLVEEQRINECLQSEDFSTTWNNLGDTTITTNDEVAPDGNTTADLIGDDGAAARFKSGNITVANSETYACSVFIKKDSVDKTTRWPALRVEFAGGSTTRVTVGLDTSDGETASSVSGGGTEVDSGVEDWDTYWRLYAVFTNDASGNTVLNVEVWPAFGDNANLLTFNSSATGEIHAWGAQAEQGAFPTSYIATTTTSETRAADDATNTTGIAALFNVNTGTLVTEFRTHFDPNLANFSVGQFDDTTGDVDRYVHYNPAGETLRARLQLAVGSDGQVNFASTAAQNTDHIWASAFQTDDMQSAVDGVLGTQDTSVGTPTGITRVVIGRRGAGGEALNGFIKTFMYFDERLPDAFLQDPKTSGTAERIHYGFQNDSLARAALTGPTLSFTRASDATHFDSSGTLQTQSSGNERFASHVYDADESAWRNLGYLVEEQRINELIRSEEFDNAAWSLINGATRSANTDTAPDENTTADTVTDPGASFSFIQSAGVTVGDSETWAISVFVKKDSTGKATRFGSLRIRMQGGTATAGEVYFDTSTGETNAVVQSGTGTVVDSGAEDHDTYWRVFIVFTNNATGNTTGVLQLFPAIGAGDLLTANYDTNATGSVVLWGAQAENASFPTSYIATTTTSETRAADVVDNTADIEALYNVNAGTMFVEFRKAGALENNVIVSDFSETSGGEETTFALVSSGAAGSLSINTTGNDGLVTTGTVVLDTDHNMAGAWANNDAQMAFDGTLGTQDTSLDQPSPSGDKLTQLGIGIDPSSNTPQLNGFIKTFAYFDERKDDSILQVPHYTVDEESLNVANTLQTQLTLLRM